VLSAANVLGISFVLCCNSAEILAAHTLFFVHGLWACKSGEDIATIKIKIYLLIKSLSL
jgi:hypothetical protein